MYLQSIIIVELTNAFINTSYRNAHWRRLNVRYAYLRILNKRLCIEAIPTIDNDGH